jgi:hypothetical protein
MLRSEDINQVALIKPDGSLLLVLLKDILDPELCKIAYEQLRHRKGHQDYLPGGDEC